MKLLRRHYPAHIMPDLQRYSQSALDDMADCFPHAHNVKRHNLDKFLEVRHPAQSFSECADSWWMLVVSSVAGLLL